MIADVDSIALMQSSRFLGYMHEEKLNLLKDPFWDYDPKMDWFLDRLEKTTFWNIYHFGTHRQFGEKRIWRKIINAIEIEEAWDDLRLSGPPNWQKYSVQET